MNRIPVLDVEKIESLSENLGLVVGLNSQTLLRIDAPAQTLL